MLSERDMVNILRHRCEAVGGQKAFSDQSGFSPQYVCDVLKGRRNVSPRMAKYLGYKCEMIFAPCNTSENGR